ncbi:heavy-metal-associated domain-containing protein [Bdellovibrio svalbardensis]|uniref:Heavy-metal-associated domain-containing protein n=1 Tax=Bdellovibrio svalbardensis TaxID=2972972 RepID=A0ABT6DLG2_9BACT|nr:heavy metal-associated domain-containing protein [Bdellovibrio svalbardensis]MDG0817724.1 heavy-metal-associated domain-containing protein [Bdellovibrio svalbardensis]
MLLALSALFISQAALAETITYNVEGMHCGSCAKMIHSKVCTMDGMDKCEVTMGKVVISPKAGIKFTQEQIQSAVSKAGDYKVTGSNISK